MDPVGRHVCVLSYVPEDGDSKPQSMVEAGVDGSRGWRVDGT